MATVTRYVNTASSGGDGTTNGTSGATAAYATLAAWHAAEATNLVSDGDSHVVNCSGTAVDNSEVDLTTWTTGASNTLTIQGNRSSGDGFNDTGIFSTSYYRLSNNGTTTDRRCIRTRTDYITIDGIQFVYETTTSNQILLIQVNGHPNTSNDVDIRNCIFKLDSSNGGGNRYMIEITDADSNLTVTNCLFDSANPASTGAQLLTMDNMNTCTVHNCTFYNGDNAIRTTNSGTYGTLNIYNSAIANMANNDVSIGTGTPPTINADYNATDNQYVNDAGSGTDIRGANGIALGSSTEWNAAWDDPSTNDFFPEDNATYLKQNGSNSYGLSTDMTETAWSATKDIGCLAVPAAAGGSVPPLSYHHRFHNLAG